MKNYTNKELNEIYRKMYDEYEAKGYFETEGFHYKRYGICEGLSIRTTYSAVYIQDSPAGRHISLFSPDKDGDYFWPESDKKSRLNALALMIAMTED